jgi:TatD DNase family protein
MIDSHCHLTDPQLHSRLADVLAHASRMGVKKMITIGTGLDDDRQCVELCRDRDYLRCAVGVHPGYVDSEDLTALPQLREIQADPSVVAIGEIGLDYFRGKANVARQMEFLQFQLNLAVEVDRPLVIHSREAIDDCLGVLKDFPTLKAVFHCFTGTADEARKILDAGYMIGFTGVITYKKSDLLREVVKFTPIQRMLVETDAPYLTPEPMRKQKVNEPALVTHVAAKVAEVKGMTLGEVEAITTANCEQLFRWK